MTEEDKKTYDRSIMTQNRRGDWVPSIPLPFLGFRKTCSCGEKFWTMKSYRGHYALEHILGMNVYG